MEKRNILIVTYTYPPSNVPAAQRPYALAKYLDKSKYNITVIICSTPDSSLGFDAEFNEELKDVNLIKIPSKVNLNVSSFREPSKGVKKKNFSLIQKIKSLIFKIGSKFIFPDKAIFWLPNVKKQLIKEKEIILNTDVLFTTSPLITNHLIGSYIKSKNPKIKWIADFRDFHFIENWSKRKGLLSYYHKKIENKILKQADRITFISSAMKDVYKKHYNIYEDKMNFIYNGYDPDDFNKLIIKPIDNKRLTIFYAGSFYKGTRSPFPLLKFLDKAIENNIIKENEFLIKIAGNFDTMLIDKAITFKSFSSIKFLGRLPRSQVLKEMVNADLLWLIVGNEITHYTGIPIKFYEYLAARRPIINFAPDQSEPTKIINEYNLGWNFDFDKTDEGINKLTLNNILLNFKQDKYKNPLPENIINKFTRNQQSKLFEKLIDG